jgi:hypothetical protein
MGGFNPNDYEGVDSRIHRFYENHPEGRIITELVEIYRDEAGRPIQYILRAEAYRDRLSTIPDATGYAEETVSVSTAPKSSLLETGETSAIGRCLANLGYSPKGFRPSREEMTKADRQTGTAAAKPPKNGGPTDGYVETAVLKLRCNALSQTQKTELLNRWPLKLKKPIPDMISPSVAAELERLLNSIENPEEAAANAADDPCATCGTATVCPLPMAAAVLDPQCRHYQGEEE